MKTMPATKQDILDLGELIRQEMREGFRAMRQEIRDSADDVLEQIGTVIGLVDERSTHIEMQISDIREGLKLASQ